MNGKVKESDWKRFRKIVPELREAYLKEKNRELARILTDSKKTPTEQFWDAFEKMKKERKILVDCLDGHSRSNMFMSMALMCRYGMLKEEQFVEKTFSPSGEAARCWWNVMDRIAAEKGVHISQVGMFIPILEFKNEIRINWLIYCLKHMFVIAPKTEK